MKSIISFISSNYGISFIYVILAYISSALSSPPPCGLYGAPPCQFLPAPPGQTPTCARPGKTYCEHVDNYPTYLIKHLVHKWGYEAKNLLVDETWDDFAAVAWHDTPVFYDPAYIFPQRNNYGNNGKDFNGYNYETPTLLTGPAGANAGAGGSGSGSSFLITKQNAVTEPPTFLLYSSAGQRLNLNKNKNQVTPYNPTLWLKRIVRDLSRPAGIRTTTQSATESPQLANNTRSQISQTASASTASKTASPLTSPSSSSSFLSTSSSAASSSAASRDVSLNMDLLDIVGVARSPGSTRSQRVKRQSPGRSSLCSTTSQFITPQAALNSKGNWMFVVNEQNSAKQLVKAELCASNTCSNLCQLPNGYNSRCEQKFVQKRLIALQGNGQNLYVDTFWFPSCCVCTISSL